MARPRKPTRVLELKGAFRHDPQRRKSREGEPQPDEPLGEPPDTLDEAQAARWRELARMGFWLTFADRTQVEIAARLWAMMRKDDSDMKVMQQFQSALAKLGFNPVDRTRVSVQRPAPKSKLDKFRRGA